MTYSSGGLIQSTDFNGFVSTGTPNINNIWGTGSTDSGWGQASLATVAVGDTVSATNWASLVNTLSSMGSQTGVAITSRTAPVTGNTVSVLANVATDITNINASRGNAAASGTTSSTWSLNIAKTSVTGSGQSAWTITFTSNIAFADANSARYFWNAGGLIRIDMSKTSTGTDADADWNTFVGTVGTLYLSGRVAGAAQTIAGTSYTGFTRVGGTGTPSPFASTTGWYGLTPGAAATTMFRLTNTAAPYTNDYIQVTAAVNAAANTLTLVTTWVDGGTSTAGATRNISGGTDTTSPFSVFGTAPAVLVRYVPPSTTYLTNTWGTPAITGTVA